MNTSALKTFAPAVRRQLMEAVTRKLDYVLTAQTPDLLTTFAPQVAALRKLAQADRAGLVERVAYTWFNRLAALRFMDARGWHPFRARVLTPASAAETQPELLKLVRGGAMPEELKAHTEPQRLNDLLDGRIPSSDAQGEVYRHLVLAACHFYHRLLPNLFEKLDDETELLLPDDLLTEHSVVHGFRTEIGDEDCGDDQRANVEILGWLYQFYISEKKDAVMARKKAVPTEDIPAVTQLFTPHWIVRYLVENSLGRLWLQNHPDSRLREHMPYYIEDPLPEPPPYQPEWQSRIPLQGDGDFRTFLWLRPNPDLKLDLEAITHYALTIDGYAYATEVWGIAEPSSGGAADKLDSMILDGKLTGSFEDLRAALFLWQRATKWDESEEAFQQFSLCYNAVCKAWEKEWRNHESLLPDLAAHGIDVPEAPAAEFIKINTPEEVRLVDPACGSGHMLTYAFDLLVHIYEEAGYAPSEIPGLILRHNLHGLDLCPRAAQLAELALVFKAREKSRRFFQPDHLVRPRIIELRDLRFAEGELREYIQALGLADLFKKPVLQLLHQFEEAKNFGSLIQPCLDERAISDVRSAIDAKDLGGQLFLRETHLKILRVLEQAEALTQQYHVVVANPPYMGSGGINGKLKTLLEAKFPHSRSDLSTVFVERTLSLALAKGFSAMVTMHNWMFLGSFEKMRDRILQETRIATLAHFGVGAFTSLNSKVVQTVAFSLQPGLPDQSNRPVCFRLLEGNEEEKDAALLLKQDRFSTLSQSDMGSISGSLFAYWLSPRIRKLLAGETLAKLGDAKRGLQPGDVVAMVRAWWECSSERTELSAETRSEALLSKKRWFKFDNGGPFRKWFGNNTNVVDWENNGRRIKGGQNPIVPSEHLYFQPGFVWSRLTSGFPSFRFHEGGSINGDISPCFFPSKLEPWTLGLLNSVCSRHLLAALSPTLTFLVSDVLKLPSCKQPAGVGKVVDDAVHSARADWDNFETSWEFRDQPLLRPGLKEETLEASWRNWEAQSSAAIRRMQELETENNRLFIAAYGLEGELRPEVPEEQITLARADTRTDMAAFLSYAVGCMMGRYSPDHPGLILANVGDSAADFRLKLAAAGLQINALSFLPDEDGIIPVLDGEWFEDDIVARTRDFLRATFGESTLRENLRFIEDALGKDLRKYFLTDFYKDHLQTYKKRPIYWLVQSPKKGFNVLLYLHRYTRDTMNGVLNRYLRDYQVKLRNRITHLAEQEATATSAKAKTEARKEGDKLKKILHECEEWERQTLLPLAQARIELDLDDGVKVNYLKLGEALAPIPGLAAKED